MFLVVDNPKATKKFMGCAYGIYETRAEALRWILKSGMRPLLHIVETRKPNERSPSAPQS